MADDRSPTGHPGAPAHSSWGRWGAEDRLGTLNLLTESRVLSSLTTVRSGTVVSLSAAADQFDPPLFGRPAMRRTVTPLGAAGAAFDEVLDGWNTQSASQWDGFGHVSEPNVGSYNGIASAEHGVDAWARHGIVGRGVLVDLPRFWAAPRDPFRRGTITPDDLRDALRAQDVEIRGGDMLLIRTGWLDAYRALDRQGRTAVAAGSGESLGLGDILDVSELLWDWQVAAVAADNPSLEAWPPPDSGPAGQPSSLHRALLCRLGIPIGELWDLEELAARCAVRGAHDFLCVSVPLTHRNAVASPANAIAVL